MREYGIVSPQFWIGETGKKIRGDINSQLIALYLMTSPHSHMTGVFHCPVLYMSYETGITFEGASKGLQRLIEVGFCEYDHSSETVFVVKMAMYQIGDSLKPGDNRIAGLKKELSKMPETPMKYRFIEIYNRAFCLEMEIKKSSPFESPLKPLRSQDQEQDQEQEQEQEQGKPPPLSPPTVEEKKSPPDETESAKTESPSDEGLTCGNDPPFEIFWIAYPKKVGKDAARKAWNRIKKPHETLALILKALDWQRKSDQWTKGNAQFIPNPATYLNQGRWMDERPQPRASPGGKKDLFEKNKESVKSWTPSEFKVMK